MGHVALVLCGSPLVIYGSLYPFGFDAGSFDSHSIPEFLESWRHFGGRGDILGNILLFLPLGAFGMLAAPHGRAALPHLILVAFVALLPAIGVQDAQLAIPARDAVLGDVFWNMGGLILGALPFCSAGMRRAVRNRSVQAGAVLPIFLIVCWYGAELAPYVPNIDFQSFKDALKPLLLYPTFYPLSFIGDYAARVAVAYLTARVGPCMMDWLLLIGVMGLMFAAKVVVVKNVVTLSDAAAAAALATWGFLLRRFSRSALVVAVLLAASIPVVDLKPFTVYDAASAFQWIPFAMADGSAAVDVVERVAEKVFQCGALIFLLLSSGFRAGLVFVLGFGLFVGIETVQMWVGDSGPSITDPLIAAMASLAVIKMYRAVVPQISS